jgi:FKBP-type peptidyl-prolyl cis-trans isomerase SlpA
MPNIAEDSHVTLHYRLTLRVQGVEQELVNTFGSGPATLQMGVGQWFPELERRLLGLAEGTCTDFDIPKAGLSVAPAPGASTQDTLHVRVQVLGVL